MTRLGLILLSGGLDSTTAAAWARREEYALSAVTFDYGQTHVRELDSARRVASAMELDHHVLDVALYRELADYSALTNPELIEMPKDRSTAEMSDDIPSTYVPLRNTFFLTMAAAWLESLALRKIERDGAAPDSISATLIIAANAIDYSGYPDCRPEFYDAVAETLRLGSKLGTQYGIPFNIETPLIELSKADIVRLATELDAPLDLTWSCYDRGAAPCGRCDSCLLRQKGFEEAGLGDPALE
jgi:7-cyano-7-deazaguanine synthase